VAQRLLVLVVGCSCRDDPIAGENALVWVQLPLLEGDTAQTYNGMLGLLGNRPGNAVSGEGLLEAV
jgi:hypothetical protein